MSEPQSAPVTSAATPQGTETETAIQQAVSQVKEARSKEMSLKGLPELAKIFKPAPPAILEKPEPDAAATATPSTPEGETAAATDPAAPASAATPDADAAKVQERKLARQRELADLAKTGHEKWQAKQAQKQQKTDYDKQRAELDAERVKIAAEKAQLELAVKDPFSFLESRGLPPEALAKEVFKRGDPTHQAESVRAEFEAWKKEQKEAMEADTKAREAAQENERRAALHVQARQVEQKFVQMVVDEAKYPSLNALYSPEEILLKAHRLAAAARAADPNAFYTDSEIADHLEQEAAPRLQKLRGSPVQTPPVPEPPAANPGPTAQGHKSRTLSSELQSEVAVDADTFKKLTRSKQNAILGERLKQRLEAKGAK